jgi:hypothetical protein
MKIFALFSLFLVLLPMVANAQDDYGCQKESLEIREKASDGSTLRLEFRSLWAVEKGEWADTRVWLRLERVHICKDGLRKEGTQHLVRAKRIE